jgi:hypothetical protein
MFFCYFQAMKPLITFALLFSIFTHVAFAQSPTVIQQQAQLTADAFIHGDYTTSTKHTYPKLVAGMGGQQQLIQKLKQGMNQMTAQGISFKDVAIGEPGTIYHAGTKLHSLIPQTLKLKVNGGTLVSTSYLIAISSDKGKSWSFVDAAKITNANVKKLFPNFNSQLVIPPVNKPVFYKDLI